MNFENYKHNPILEDLTQVLVKKTQINNPLFYRVLIAYYMGKVAGIMNPMIQTLDRGAIPINIYAINLAPSGFSKGYSTNIIESQVINQFKTKFMKETFPIIGEDSLSKMAVKRANSNGTDPDDEREEINKEFIRAGKLLFSFSEGTSPAVKQMRSKILMANCGAVNLEIDEIGSNLIANTEILNTFLELYDVGKVKQKLTKNTADNVRGEDLDGITPTNMMLFGTPDKLLDGGKVEEEFMSFLDTGYARRCLFAFIKDASNNMLEMTPKEILAQRMNKNNDSALKDVSDKLAKLAEPQHHGKTILVDIDVTEELITYELFCEQRLSDLPASDRIRRAEMKHRYFKSLKLAGAFAFIDESTHITMDHLHSAIKLVEESGEALKELLKRDKAHVKLAKYLAERDEDVTQAELIEDVPSFKGSIAAKNDQIALATAWGYKNNIVIKKSFVDGIEFLSADSLKETNLDEMIISVSDDVAFNYNNTTVKWDEIGQAMMIDNMHWCVHHLRNGHRKDENVITGFNQLVIDVDGDLPLEQAKTLLEDYKCLFYTTKRHTEEVNRYRIIFPMNYILNLDSKDYKEFMQNVYDWLPFEVDDSTSDRPRKWLTNDGEYYYNDGELIDVLPFIPKTTKAEEQRKILLDSQSLDNLERWFVRSTGKGNRSNQMIKYALMLVDTGSDLIEVQDKIFSLNERLQNPMKEEEINTTIIRTVRQKIRERDS